MFLSRMEILVSSWKFSLLLVACLPELNLLSNRVCMLENGAHTERILGNWKDVRTLN